MHSLFKLRRGYTDLAFNLPGTFRTFYRFHLKEVRRVANEDGSEEKMLIFGHRTNRSFGEILLRASSRMPVVMEWTARTISTDSIPVPVNNQSMFKENIAVSLRTPGTLDLQDTLFFSPDEVVKGSDVMMSALLKLIRLKKLRRTQKLVLINSFTKEKLSGNRLVWHMRWGRPRVRAWQKQSILMHTLHHYFKKVNNRTNGR